MQPYFERIGAQRLGLALVVAFALLCTIALWPSDRPLPREVRAGATLAGLIVPGQGTMTSPDGLRVSSVHGEWVRVHFGPDDEQGRWFHFRHVVAFSTPVVSN